MGSSRKSQARDRPPARPLGQNVPVEINDRSHELPARPPRRQNRRSSPPDGDRRRHTRTRNPRLLRAALRPPETNRSRCDCLEAGGTVWLRLRTYNPELRSLAEPPAETSRVRLRPKRGGNTRNPGPINLRGLHRQLTKLAPLTRRRALAASVEQRSTFLLRCAVGCM